MENFPKLPSKVFSMNVSVIVTAVIEGRSYEASLTLLR